MGFGRTFWVLFFILIPALIQLLANITQILGYCGVKPSDMEALSSIATFLKSNGTSLTLLFLTWGAVAYDLYDRRKRGRGDVLSLSARLLVHEIEQAGLTFNGKSDPPREMFDEFCTEFKRTRSDVSEPQLKKVLADLDEALWQVKKTTGNSGSVLWKFNEVYRPLIPNAKEALAQFVEKRRPRHEQS